MNEEQLLEIFNATDSDKDGKITIYEFFENERTASLIKKFTISEDFYRLVRQHDSDQDGRITFEELKTAVRNFGFLVG